MPLHKKLAAQIKDYINEDFVVELEDLSNLSIWTASRVDLV